MKKLRNIIKVVVLMLILNTIPVYADEYFYWNGSKITAYDDTSILSNGAKKSRDIEYGKPRGSIISTAVVEISDEDNGNIGLRIQTLAHGECDKILHALTLQRLNKENDWEKVIRFEYEASKEDNPEEKLIALSNGVVVEDLPAGVYRASGLHAVYLGEDYEGFSTRTHGITIRR